MAGWARVAGIISFAIFGVLSLGIIGERGPDTTRIDGDSVRATNQRDNLAAGVTNLAACGLVVILLAWPTRD